MSTHALKPMTCEQLSQIFPSLAFAALPCAARSQNLANKFTFLDQPIEYQLANSGIQDRSWKWQGVGFVDL